MEVTPIPYTEYLNDMQTIYRGLDEHLTFDQNPKEFQLSTEESLPKEQENLRNIFNSWNSKNGFYVDQTNNVKPIPLHEAWLIYLYKHARVEIAPGKNSMDPVKNMYFRGVGKSLENNPIYKMDFTKLPPMENTIKSLYNRSDFRLNEKKQNDIIEARTKRPQESLDEPIQMHFRGLRERAQKSRVTGPPRIKTRIEVPLKEVFEVKTAHPDEIRLKIEELENINENLKKQMLAPNEELEKLKTQIKIQEEQVKAAEELVLKNNNLTIALNKSKEDYNMLLGKQNQDATRAGNLQKEYEEATQIHVKNQKNLQELLEKTTQVKDAQINQNKTLNERLEKAKMVLSQKNSQILQLEAQLSTPQNIPLEELSSYREQLERLKTEKIDLEKEKANQETEMKMLLEKQKTEIEKQNLEISNLGKIAEISKVNQTKAELLYKELEVKVKTQAKELKDYLAVVESQKLTLAEREKLVETLKKEHTQALKKAEQDLKTAKENFHIMDRLNDKGHEANQKTITLQSIELNELKKEHAAKIKNIQELNMQLQSVQQYASQQSNIVNQIGETLQKSGLSESDFKRLTQRSLTMDEVNNLIKIVEEREGQAGIRAISDEINEEQLRDWYTRRDLLNDALEDIQSKPSQEEKVTRLEFLIRTRMLDLPEGSENRIELETIHSELESIFKDSSLYSSSKWNKIVEDFKNWILKQDEDTKSLEQSGLLKLIIPLESRQTQKTVEMLEKLKSESNFLSPVFEIPYIKPLRAPIFKVIDFLTNQTAGRILLGILVTVSSSTVGAVMNRVLTSKDGEEKITKVLNKDKTEETDKKSTKYPPPKGPVVINKKRKAG